jgi:hypothetical protein
MMPDFAGPTVCGTGPFGGDSSGAVPEVSQNHKLAETSIARSGPSWATAKRTSWRDFAGRSRKSRQLTFVINCNLQRRRACSGNADHRAQRFRGAAGTSLVLWGWAGIACSKGQERIVAEGMEECATASTRFQSRVAHIREHFGKYQELKRLSPT